MLLQCKKYQPPGNLKLNYLDIFQSLKFRISMEKILPISLKLNFTPNTLGCCGLMHIGRHCLSKVGKFVVTLAKMSLMSMEMKFEWQS